MGNKLARTMTAEHFRVLDLSQLMVYQWHFLLATGFIIGMLITEIAGLNRDKHRLTLSMWESIKQLENEVKELKTHTQTDVRQIDEMNGGDAVMN